MKRVLLLLPALLLATVLLAAACGDEEKTPTTAPSTPTPTTAPATGTPVGPAVQTPQRIKDAGKLVAGADVAYPPLEFYKEGTQEIDGFDYDLGKALAAAMGVDFEMVSTEWDGIIPSLNAKRFDVILSAMTDNAERRQAIDFVDYLMIGTGVLVQPGNPKAVDSLDDLCGLKVSVDLATVQVDQIAAVNAQCKTDGKPEAEVTTFDSDPDAVAALAAKRNDAHLVDYPVAVYYATLPNQTVDVLTIQHETAPYGIGVRKDDPELKAALDQAMAAIIADGTYQQLLDKWGLVAGTIAAP